MQRQDQVDDEVLQPILIKRTLELRGDQAPESKAPAACFGHAESSVPSNRCLERSWNPPSAAAVKHYFFPRTNIRFAAPLLAHRDYRKIVLLCWCALWSLCRRLRASRSKFRMADK